MKAHGKEKKMPQMNRVHYSIIVKIIPFAPLTRPSRIRRQALRDLKAKCANVECHQDKYFV